MRRLIAIGWFLIVAPGTAHAEPMFTMLDDVMRQSTDIVVATFLGSAAPGSYRLQVEESLRGNRLGVIVVGAGDGGANVEVGARVVAFIDEYNGFRWVGEIPDGMPMESAPVRLRGFYEFNAHYVVPGLLTYAQLLELIRSRPFEWRFEGPLHVLSDDGLREVASQFTISVSIRSTLRARTAPLPARASGLPVEGLSRPEAAIGIYETDLEVSWNRGWPRPLILVADVHSVRDGVLQAVFRMTLPTFLFRESDIAAYLRDPRVGYAYWPLEVRFENGTLYRGSIGENYTGGPEFVTPDGRELSRRSLDERRLEFDDRVWQLGAPVAGPYLRGDDRHERRLLQELHRGPVPVEVISGVGAGERGIMHLGPVELRPPIRARRR